MKDVSFQCPFCGAKACASGIEMMHEMPMCASFDDNPPDAYLALVNDEIARQRGYRIVRPEDQT